MKSFTEYKIQTGAMNKFLKLNPRGVRFFRGISQTHPFQCGFLALFWGMTGCASHSPVAPGMVLGFTRAEPTPATNDLSYAKSLQVHWLGTACYLVQFGDRVIFTDPFLTHHSLSRVALGASIKSNPHTVS